ncbi:MAG: sulfur oxidation c-type cytochrome SoxX [Aeromicrobium sp.]|nr:sulfur oxidation c-type cytochrome SoxX [Burkholderiales bacterium]
MKKTTYLMVSLVLTGATAAHAQTKAPVADRATEVMKASFKERGQAKLDRLNQDKAMELCTKYTITPIPRKLALEIEAENVKTIPFPADGKYLGDWKAGERIAQSGVGMQFTDNPANPSGANCYACHKLAPQELSYGTIGSSLYQFGKIRGYSPEIAKYAFGKIYNSQAYAACSNMPRFGHNKILTETQIKDLVALLMDPESPVNK